MRADLHAHSTASDGTLTPTELVGLAAELGLDVLAITDHDSVEGIAEASRAADRSGIDLIPGVELSALTADGRDVHLLGYFIRHGDPHLLSLLKEMRHARQIRSHRMVSLLADAGHEISREDVELLAGGGAIGRSHVARALVDAGYAPSVSDAFERLIGRDAPYYVSKDVRTPSEVIAIIQAAGGLSVIAHPGVNRLDDLIPELIGAGLAGIEAYHADHTPEQRERYAGIARAENLLVTGGSDFHGHDARNPQLGSVVLPAHVVPELLAAGRSH